MARSVKQDVEGNRLVDVAARYRFSVRADRTAAGTSGRTDRGRLFAGDRRRRRRVERSLASASAQGERCGRQADQGETKKQAVIAQWTSSMRSSTIAKQANMAKSGFFLFQPAQPFFGLRAHVFRGGAAKAHPAFHRPVDRQDAEDILVDARLDLLHC